MKKRHFIPNGEIEEIKIESDEEIEEISNKAFKKSGREKIPIDNLAEFLVRMQLIDPDITTKKLCTISGHPLKFIEELLCTTKFDEGIRNQIKDAERQGDKKLVSKLRDKLIDAKMARKKYLRDDSVVTGELVSKTQSILSVKDSSLDPAELLSMMESLVADGVFVSYKYVKEARNSIELFMESKGVQGKMPTGMEVALIGKLTGETFKQTMIMRGRTLDTDKPIQALLESIDGTSKELIGAE